ncbi:MAG: hypothetical protein KDA42_12480 [Planctomycetales bacterium]|nr:hypothetical protein [Planctomycetales bacterium]
MNVAAAFEPADEQRAAAGGGRLSRGSKIVFGLAFGCAGLLLLLCAGIAVLPLIASSYRDPAALNNLTAEEVAVEARKIALLNVPEYFQPRGVVTVMSQDGKTRLLRTAYYDTAEGRGTLSVSSILKRESAPTSMSQILRQLRAALRERGQLKYGFQMIDTRALAVTVRGQRNEFFLSTGADSATGTRMWEVFGPFQGEGGPAFLYMRVPFVLIGEQEILDLLESIH